MALYWQNNYLSTFDKVAACYESITPIRGKQHKDQDVRPLGDRNRKWERIKKINANCYVLTDGYHSGDEVFGVWAYGNEGKPTEADMINLSPIVWRRHKDGTETVKVRNGTGKGAHNGRYSFLDRHLPHGTRFIVRNGKHFVSFNGTEYYLAKSNTVAKYAVPEDDAVRNNPWSKHLTGRDDGVALTFRIKNGVMSFEDGGKPLPVPPKVRVDKVAKAKMKDAIADFREWAFNMYPLLPFKDYEYGQRMEQEVSAVVGNKYGYGWGIMGKFGDNVELSRDIIRNPDHDLRLHLMYGLMGETDYHLEHTYNTPEEHVQKVRAQFNRHINKLCGFVKTVRG